MTHISVTGSSAAPDEAYTALTTSWSVDAEFSKKELPLFKEKSLKATMCTSFDLELEPSASPDPASPHRLAAFPSFSNLHAPSLPEDAAVTSNHAETEDPASNLVDVDLEEVCPPPPSLPSFLLPLFAPSPLLGSAHLTTSGGCCYCVA